MTTTKLLTAALASALVAGTTQAAVSITGTTVGDAPTIDNTYGTLELALDYGTGVDYGGAAVDGINFDTLSHGNQQKPSFTDNGITVALDTDDTFGYNNNANLGDPDVYEYLSYTDKGVGVIVNITGLNASLSYQIQFLTGEPRGNSWAKYENGLFGASDDIKASSPYPTPDVTQAVTFGAGGGYGADLLATVEVSGTTEAQLTLPSGAGVGPGVGGIVIHSAVPEPTSLALLGLGGLLIARRRRG